MENESLLERVKGSFVDLIDRGVDFLPKLFVALLLVFIGVLIAKLVSKWLEKALNYIESHPRYKNTLSKFGMSVIRISGFVSILAQWTILVIFLSAAVDVLELTVLTNTFQAILDFVPNIFAAALIAGLSILAGNVVHDIVSEAAEKANVSAHKVLAAASKTVVLIFGIILAASQLSLDLSIITNNLTVIVAGIMLALGLAFGLGGKEVAGKIINDLYNKTKK